MTREVYGTGHLAPTEGAVITDVAPASEAAGCGLRVGDRVIAVDGEPVRDVLEWQWLSEESEFDVTVSRAGSVIDVHVGRDLRAPLGVSFADVLFDGVRECENACAFCFVAQLPQGLRSSLYVRDDDYRLSFLNGTFITLTNLNDEDVHRIAEQRLSPLYVSIHAVDPDVRRRLICPTVEDLALVRLDELVGAGIEVHAQVVLVPGVNDGDVLDETVRWLALRDGVRSVGVVPVGHTAHQVRIRRSFEEAAIAQAVVARAEALAASLDLARRTGWLQLADEFFINAGLRVPDTAYYDGFPQYENGIGMVRAFEDELCAGAASARIAAGSVAMTGTLFAPVLSAMLAEAGLSDRVEVMSVRNGLLGDSVTVAGLLGGKDIADAIRAHPGKGPYLVPDVVVNSDGLLLDDVAGSDLSAMSGKDVMIVESTAAGLLGVSTR